VTPAGGTVTATAAGGATAHHGGGFELNTQARKVPATTLSGNLPSSVDLSRYNPPVTDQGSEAACTAYATAYYLRGWYARRDGYYPPSGFSPEFTYDQVPKGNGGGTTFSDNLNIQKSEGLDTQGDFFLPVTPNGTVEPVGDSALTNAVRYKISSYIDFTNGGGQFFVEYIKEQLAAQNPVAIGIYVSPQFENLSVDSPSDLVTDTSTKTGLHAVFAYGYDQNGLLIENQWGTDWGYNGYAELSWNYVEIFGAEVAAITPLTPTVPAWQKLPGAATAISIGANGSVWALGATPVVGGYGIYHWDAKTWTWKAVPGAAVRIAVDPNGNPWVVNSVGNIYSWDGTTFQQVPGAARDIAISRYDVVWIVSATASGQLKCAPSGCTDSVVDADYLPDVPEVKCQPSVCDGGVLYWTGSAWQQVRGTANRIAVDSSKNEPWALSTSGDMSYYMQPQQPILGLPTPTPTPTGWMPVTFPGSAKALAIPAWGAGSGEVWAIGTDGNLFRKDSKSSQWQLFSDSSAMAVAASPMGGAWVVNSNGDIYELPSWLDM
jgi:hypothetical protein